MVYFFGDYKGMIRVRDEVLLEQRGYQPCCREGDKITPACIRSPDGVIMIEFNEESPIKVCIQDEAMVDGKFYRESARPYLEQMVELFDPDKITDIFRKDVTKSLNIK